MLPRFSERLDWSVARNSVSDAVEKRRTSGSPLLDLTQSNPTAAGIVYPAVNETFGDPRMLRYEPSARGLLSARQAICDYHKHPSVRPEHIMLTASTSEAYSYLFKLLCNPGDEVLVPRPSYPLFEMLARLECVVVTQYPIHYDDGWFVDIDQLRRSIGRKTRAIAWVNPNNPTGSFLNEEEYSAIAELCNQHGLALISDEVFADYVQQPELFSLRSLVGLDECLCFTLSGLSKVCGLPQMKLGWIVASGPGREAAIDKLDWIADTFLSVGTPVQYALPGLLRQRHSIQNQINLRTSENLTYLRDRTRGAACRVLNVEGGWYATLNVPQTRSEEGWTLDLIERGVLVQPGYFFDFEAEAYLILSLLTESQIFRKGVEHILDAC